MHDNPSAALHEEVEPGLAATPPDNLARRDNNLAPNHSNTRTGQAVGPAYWLVEPLSQGVADLLP